MYLPPKLDLLGSEGGKHHSTMDQDDTKISSEVTMTVHIRASGDRNKGSGFQGNT